MTTYKYITITLFCATLLTTVSTTATEKKTEESAITRALRARKAKELKKAPDSIYALFGKKLKNAKKKDVPVDLLTDKIIGVYFSAHWCPPCCSFTPVLVKFHNDLTKQNKAFEVVFVSSDRDKKAMYNYMKETQMPWLALPHGDKHKETLAKKFNVRGIPKLVILNAQGELITENGRGDVSRGDTSIYDKWITPKTQ